MRIIFQPNKPNRMINHLKYQWQAKMPAIGLKYDHQKLLYLYQLRIKNQRSVGWY